MESRTKGNPAPKGTPPRKPPVKKRRSKIGWKQLLAAVVVIVVIWQVGKSLDNSGKNSPNGTPAAQGSGTSGSGTSGGPSLAPTSAPTTQAPMVTIGGHQVSAVVGPLYVGNTGLLLTSGHVS